MEQQRTVTVIPATINPITKKSETSLNKRRVAGYARVSTDKDEQFTSYEAQVDYYTNYIKQHKEWFFIKVYTDEGISGLNTKKREGFNEMISDALDGKIDLIITKVVAQNQEEYNIRYNGYFERYEALKAECDELVVQKEKLNSKRRKTEQFITNLVKNDNLLSDFDDWLWLTTVDKVVVQKDGGLLFKFYNGLEMLG